MKRIPVECYSRVVGYFRPIKQFNIGKQEEFYDRKVSDPKQVIKQMEDKNVL